MRTYFLTLMIFLSLSDASFAQESAPSSFEGHFELARKYDNLSLYAESIDEITSAIRIAKKNGWRQKHLEASIFLAETKRKTKDYFEGIEILRALDYSTNYPDLHVEKLGRMAALYHECNLPNEQKYDSVERYLYTALNLAKKYNLLHEKALLYNELGYRMGHRKLDSCLYLLGEASNIFMAVGDTQNYVVSRTNMLRTYETVHDDQNATNTFKELVDIVKEKNWYTLERELYATISAFYYNRNDSVNANYWMVRCRESELLNVERISTTRLNSYRAIYETQKYQEQVAKKESELQKESKRRNELIIYISVLLLLIAGVTVFLFRERRLKKSLGKANDNYQMLIVESNHRIKNNLQMIISMLKYESKDSSDAQAKAYEVMSSKINTISALHKHLYADVHNEHVDLAFYFNEIINLHKEMALNNFKIVTEIDPVSIRSERIVYFGLIFNEMLSNTFEHGNANSKELKIKVTQVGNQFHFSYQDYSQFSAKSKQGKGIVLIQELIRRVKGTGYQLDPSIGRYRFSFTSD